MRYYQMRVMVTFGILIRATYRVGRIWLRLVKVERALAGIQYKLEKIRLEIRPLADRVIAQQSAAGL